MNELNKLVTDISTRSNLMLLRNNLSQPYSDATIDILSLDIYGCNARSVNKAPRSSARPSTNETTHPVATVAAPDRVAKAVEDPANLIRRNNYADVVRRLSRRSLRPATSKLQRRFQAFDLQDLYYFVAYRCERVFWDLSIGINLIILSVIPLSGAHCLFLGMQIEIDYLTLKNTLTFSAARSDYI